MKFISAVFIAVIVACAYADECNHYTVEVKTMEELKKAVKNARPGCNITLAPVTFEGSLVISLKGELHCPIIFDSPNGAMSYGASISTSDSYGIRFDHASYILFKGIEITSEASPDYGIVITDSEGIEIRDNVINSVNTGVMIVGGKNNVVSLSTFSNIKNNSIWVGYKSKTTSTEISQCHFSRDLSGVPILVDSHAKDTKIELCLMKPAVASYPRAIHVLGTDTSIVGNQILYDQITSPVYSEAILIEGRGCTFKDNKIDATAHDVNDIVMV